MAVARGLLFVAVLLFGVHCSSLLPACPESCTCQRAPLLNCSFSGLSLVPQHIQESVTELDLSHNLLNSVTLLQPHRNLRNVWLGNNTITHLSLCIERNLGSQHVRDRHLRRSRPWIRRGCVSWAPTLQLLSVERNQLEQLPEGLQGSESLQVLQLSFNRISTLPPGDLRYLHQLKELHLQHNLITTLQPQMFQDLTQLRVLDLSFNMLTSLHPLMYLSLRNIGANVRLDGNRWHCDCIMRSLRRQMAYDNSRGLQTWSILCASPSIFSGKDLLQLEEDDLNCLSTANMPVLHRDVTVYSGSEILLSCSTQESVWWTPTGQASVSQPQTDLLINDITERDVGLYVCVSEDHRVKSIFNLQITKIGGTKRNTRSLSNNNQQIIPQDTLNRIGQERNRQVPQSDLTLAVCLSVFITFLIAFILGVLARPCIDVLWKRVTKKKRSPATNSGSPAEQRQYDNEAFSSGEEPGEIPTHRERRVTFSTVDFREDINVQYYDAVAGGSQESINDEAVIVCEVAVKNKHTTGDSGSEKTLRQKNGKITDEGRKHNMEFEHIPDRVELEERRSLSSSSSSSSSDSSLSDKVLKEDQMTQGDRTIPKSPQLATDSVQQRPDFLTATKVEVPQISIEGTSEVPGFPSEPFTEWSPHTNNNISTDLDEEQFEFSDSVRSTSARSSIVFGSFNDVAPSSDNQKRDDVSSSSSYVSEDEPTHYTVNSDTEEEENIERNHKNGDNRYDTQRPPLRPEHSLSSDSSDSDGKLVHCTVKRETDKEEGKEKYISDYDKPSSRIVTVERDTKDKAPSLSSNSSSSSDSEDEAFYTDKPRKIVIAGLPLQESPTVSHNSTKPFPVVDLEHIPRIKRRLDIKAQSLDSDSSSSSDSENETTYCTDRPGKSDKAELPLQKDLHLKPPSNSDSSSSSDSENETGHTEKQRPGKVDVAELQFQPLFPVLDLEHIPRIERRLDIKAPSPAPDTSSSSDSEDETTGHTDNLRPGKVDIPYQTSQTVHRDPDKWWPAIDLEHIPHIKKRLDIKATSPPSDSSFKSEIVEVKIPEIKKHEQEEVHITKLPFPESKAESHDPITRWPAIELEHTMHIKRRLDIKAPSMATESSSSSDSEDETTNSIKKQEQGETHTAKLPVEISHEPETRWPALDLEHITRVKRRLDIKAPLPASESSSSSDSEDETTNSIKKQEQGETHTAKLPVEISHDPETRWPALDLEHITRLKRRLDIKAPLPASESSSSSDSEDETTNSIKKQEQGETHTAKLPVEISQTVTHEPETRWPALDLEHTTRIKRRLDVKAPPPPSDSSTSSGSEDEIIDHTEKWRPAKPNIAELPLIDPDSSWPAVDFEHLPHIKRRLDIKAPSMAIESSSSSDSEDETTNSIKKQEQGETHTAKLPVEISHEPETRWPTLDLEHITRVKRRLDIKAPLPASESSSSSDSEDETTNSIKKQEQGETHTAKLPETWWPALDLEHTTRIKRRLDVKAPPPPPSDSSTSSDSENEIIDHTEKQRPAKPNIAELPLIDLDSRWPAVDFEHLPHIKRRLDIKAPLPTSDSSSSSDSEDETTNSIKKQDQGETHTTKSPETWWPALDLEHTTRIKRRLDVKAPAPPSDSSTSSDSEDEIIDQTEKQRPPAKMDVADILLNGPDATWPTLDLNRIPHIKRRLDIKSPPPESSSNSEIVEETLSHINKHEQGAVHTTKLPFQKSEADTRDPEKKWPVLELMHPIRIKRRLDIKARSQYSDSSSSSDSEDETTYHTQKPENMNIVELPLQKSQTMSHDPETQWPTVDLSNITRIKRRLDIKASSPPNDLLLIGASMDHTVEGKRNDANKISPYYSSSSSDEGDDMDNLRKSPIKLMPDPDPRWPELDFSNANRVKRHLDIKVRKPSLGSSSSSESDSGTTNLKVEEDRRDHKDVRITKNEQGIPHINRRLDIKVTSPQPDLGLTSVSVGSRQSSSSSSSSESEDEKTNLNAKVGIGLSAVSKASEKKSIMSSKTPLTDHNIKLEKYTVITDNASSISTNDNKTLEINPELQLRWATMNLGISRFRKRLDITSRASPSSFSSEDEGKRWKVTSRLPVVTDKEASQNHTSQSETQQLEGTDGVELKSETSGVVVESDSMWPQLSLTKIPTVKRALDIRAPLETESSSSSNSEDETLHHSVPNLSLGVPRIKRRLNIKAPSPEQSDSPSSCSEDGNEVKRKESRYTSNMSGQQDNESLITYKRLIMKAPSLPSNSFSPSGQSQTTHLAEMVPDVQDGPSRSVGDRIKSFSPSRVLSASFGDVVKKKTDHSRSTTDVDFPPEIRWTGISRHLSDLSVSSSKSHLDVDLSTPQQAPAFIAFDNSTGGTNEILRDLSDKRREKKGLSALKIMSSERQKWDTDSEVLHREPPMSDNHDPNNDHQEIKFLAKRPLTQFYLSSTSSDERRAADLLYGFPKYRGHGTGDTDPPQEAPPPVPATPPPDEAVELTWRSPQRSKITTRNMDFDSSKMNISDV